MDAGISLDWLGSVSKRARKRLRECDQELGMTTDLVDRGGERAAEARGRVNKLRERGARYRRLLARLEDDRTEQLRGRATAIREHVIPGLVAEAARNQRRAIRVEALRRRAEERQRSVRTRFLVLQRELEEAERGLGVEAPEALIEPPELREPLGKWTPPPASDRG